MDRLCNAEEVLEVRTTGCGRRPIVRTYTSHGGPLRGFMLKGRRASLAYCGPVRMDQWRITTAIRQEECVLMRNEWNTKALILN